MDEVAEIDEVLVQQAALVSEAELKLERPSSRGGKFGVPGHHRLHRVAGQQMRDHEVDRDRRPGGDDVERQPANDEPHLLSSPQPLIHARCSHPLATTVWCGNRNRFAVWKP